MEKQTIKINNLLDLKKWTKKLSNYLLKQKLPFYLLLNGDLGAGKTTLTRELLINLGVQNKVTSPTFVILNQYESKLLKSKINHMDAYRLSEIEDLGLYEEEFSDSLNIIEWSDNLTIDWSDKKYLKIKIEIIDFDSRMLFIG